VADVEAFHTLAEVSITFTGLAGIVSVVGRSSLTSEARQWRVWNMILLSLLAFFLCVVPIAMSQFPLTSDIVWILCSVFYVVTQMSQSYFANRVGSNIGTTAEYTIRPLLLIYFVGSVLMAILQILNIFVFIPGSGPFFIGICWFMLLAALHFFVLVMNSDLNKGAT
jgi:hypothetical protein